jgi:hypothetical protein
MLTNMYYPQAGGNFSDEHRKAIKQQYNWHMGYEDKGDMPVPAAHRSGSKNHSSTC